MMMSRIVRVVVAALALGVGIAAAEQPRAEPTFNVADADHKLMTMWMGTLKDVSDRLDDCTYKGAFANADRVPDTCNAAFTSGGDLIRGSDKTGLPVVMQRNCAKWVPSTGRSEKKKDCEELGRRYWHLAEAIDRATIANGSASERQKTVDLGNFATDYVAKFNPEEVKSYREQLRDINDALDKPSPPLWMVFHAGEIDADILPWLLSHCPSELAWGIPTKPYTTAVPECVALEPELLRFNINVLKLIALAERQEKAKK
jgi:hypothetical protein